MFLTLLIGSFDADLYDRIVKSMLFRQIGGRNSVIVAHHPGMHRYLVHLVIAVGIEAFAAAGRTRDFQCQLCVGFSARVVGNATTTEYVADCHVVTVASYTLLSGLSVSAG